MPRPHRDFTTNDRFHIINHGVDSQDLFSINDDWILFESMIGRVCEEYSFRLNAYALMSNHYHLLADLSRCEERNGVSEAIGVLQSTSAKYFNDRTERRGPLFEPRFLSYGVDGDAKTHRSVRYIHRNPIDICGPKALGNYRWSSLPVLLGRRKPPPWLDCSLFTPLNPSAHVADLAGCREEDLWPIGALPPQRRTTVDAIQRAVDAVCTDRSLQQMLTFMLVLDLRACDVVTIAEQFGCGESKIRKLARSGRLRRQDEPGFSALVDRIVVQLARR